MDVLCEFLSIGKIRGPLAFIGRKVDPTTFSPESLRSFGQKHGSPRIEVWKYDALVRSVCALRVSAQRVTAEFERSV